MAKKSFNIWRRYRAFFPAWREYKKYVVHIMVFLVTATIVGIVPALLQRKVFDHAIPAGDQRTLIYILLGLIVINILIFLLNAISDFILTLILENKRLEIIVSFFEKLLHLRHEYYNTVSLGEVNRIYRDGEKLGEAGRIFIMEMLNGFIVALCYYPILFLISWPLTVLRLLIFPLNFMVGNYFIKKDRALERKIWEKSSAITTHLNETFKGVRTIKVFGAEKRSRQITENYHIHLKRLLIRRRRYSFMWGAIQNLISGVINGVVFFVAATTIINGDFTFGAFIAFNIINGQAQQSVSRLFGGYKKLVQSCNSVDRFEAFTGLDTERNNMEEQSELNLDRGDFPLKDFNGEDTEIFFPSESILAKKSICTKKCSSVKSVKNSTGIGEIKIEHLSFSYDGINYALRDISMNIPMGKRCAIVGRSGSGKSTITNLLMGFYAPLEGDIWIDQRNIKEISPKALRSNIGIVQQDNFFFNDTIRENLVFGDKSFSDKEIWEALKSANAFDFIVRLERGLDTIYGEKGTNFSGGQKQRLAIARVFLRNPRLVILDEATSSLDLESEELIQHSLDKLLLGRTSITIAHRLSTIVNSDIIYVLDNGEIVGKGDHGQLLKNNRLYTRLYHCNTVNGLDVVSDIDTTAVGEGAFYG